MDFTNCEANLQGNWFDKITFFLNKSSFLVFTATMGDVNAAVERLLSQI
jgi:hypothetical protein